jgi:aerobic carbon-monoxide dehydrogenase medium subunit
VKPFAYLAPTDLGEAVAALNEHAGQASVIAGGQSLLLAMKQRQVNPRALVSVGGIPELSGVTAGAVSEPVTIGAATTYATLERASFDGWHAEIAAVAGDLADRPVRTMGTIGGSLCQGEPRFDFPAVVVGVDAQLELVGATGARHVTAEDFLSSGRQRDGEILARIHLPPLDRFTGVAFHKFRYRRFDQALASVTCAAQVDEGGVIRELRISVGAVHPQPTLARAVAEQLVGTPADDVVATEAGRAVAVEVRPLESAATDLERYQHELVAVLTRKSLDRALNRTRS